MPKKQKLDDQDYAILNALRVRGDISNKELAEIIELSPSATLNRVQKLKDEKYIKEVTTQLNYKKLGFDYHVLLIVKMQTDQIDRFLTVLEGYNKFIRYWEIPVYYSSISFESYLILEGLFESHETYTEMWEIIRFDLGQWIPTTVFKIDDFEFFDNNGWII